MYQKKAPQNLQENFLNYGEIMRCSWTDAEKKEEILDKEIEDLIAERQEARKAKNLQEQMRSEMSFWLRESSLKIPARE